MVIWITSLWVLLDTAFCLYTEIELHPLTATEWILAGASLLFAVGALIAEFLEREAHAKEIGDIKLGQATGHANLSGKLDVMALVGGETFRQLQAVTQTNDKPVRAVIEAATLKIELLTKQVSLLNETSRHVTSEQRRRFGRALPFVLPEEFNRPFSSGYLGVRITHGSTVEAKNYAEELMRLFGEYAITTTLTEEVTHESLNVRGLRVLIADPSNPSLNDQRTLKLLDAAQIEYGIEAKVTDLPRITTLRVGKLSTP